MFHYRSQVMLLKNFLTIMSNISNYGPTPRAVSSTNMTKSSYVDSVIKAVHDVCSKKDIVVKLLLSIDRGRTIEDAWDTLKLAEDYAAKPDPSVVGLDFSGNPSVRIS